MRDRRPTPIRLLARVVAAERVQGRARTALLAGSLAFVGLVASLNTITKMSVSLSILYLLPVLVTAVAISPAAAYLLAAPAAVAWTFDRLLIPHDARNPWTSVANGLLRYAAMSLVIALIGVLRDALRDAQRSDRRSKEFLAYAAHQLRTPVAGVRASSEALLLSTDPSARDQLLSSIASETRRMGRVVSSLLRITRLDQGDPLEIRATDLQAEITAEVQRCRDLAPGIDVRLETTPAVLPVVDADPVALVELLANLLDNARRHALSRISVEASRAGEVLTLRIDDDGPGLPAGVEELAFDRFVSLDGQGGSGLGLPIARSLAQAHGGQLVYVDKAFVVTLLTPVADTRANRHRRSVS